MTNSDIASVLSSAVSAHRAGRLDAAAAGYRQVLARQKDHFDALNLLGLVEHAQGRWPEALACFDRALKAQPGQAGAHYNRANTLMEMGRLEEAAAGYRKAVTLQPVYPDAWLNLGAVLHRAGDLAGATAAFEELVRLSPADARGHYNLAKVYAETQRTQEAIRALQQALRLAPDSPEWWSLLGGWLTQATRHDEAIAAQRRACALRPGQAEMHFNLGCALYAAAAFDEAVRSFTQATQLRPDFAAAYNNLGEALRDTRDFNNAIKAFDQALMLDPHMTAATTNKAAALSMRGYELSSEGREDDAGVLYRQAYDLAPAHPDVLRNHASHLIVTNRLDEAIEVYRKLITVQPDDTSSYVSFAGALLNAGRFEEGWPAYQRHRFTYDVGKRPPEDKTPLWSSEPLAGREIVACCEYGLGDEILTASMVPDLIASGAMVTLLCSERLVTVFQRSFPAANVRPHAMSGRLSTGGDARQMTVSELGRAFRPARASFPDRRAFLAADLGMRDALRNRYREQADGRHVVGIAWHSAHPEHGDLKNILLTDILTGLNDPAIMLFNLQYGDHRAEIDAAVRQTGVALYCDADLDPMRDVDAAVSQVAAMDAVVTISNTTAHIAGGLGAPTFLLLPQNRTRHWYWHRAFADCPWYPSIQYVGHDRLHRWDAVLRDLRSRILALPTADAR